MDMNRPDYNLSQNEVLERYSTFRTGLSSEEARNATVRTNSPRDAKKPRWKCLSTSSRISSSGF